MSAERTRRVALLALWAAFGVFVVWGAVRAPFHPDESTVLYLSHDLDVLLEQGPGAVTWQATGQPADVLRYRLLLCNHLFNRARNQVEMKRFGDSVELADQFVGMYVNHWTLDYGERGRKSIRLFLDRAFEQGLIPRRQELEFVV